MSIMRENYLMRVCCPKIEWDKGKPDDTSCVHGESDVFGLVEVFRYFSCFYRIKSTDGDEYHAVNLNSRIL